MKKLDDYIQTCELTQLSISDAIDANENLNCADALHIESCAECAKFYQLWMTDSSVTSIASGSLIDQMNLSQPILSQLEKSSTIIPLRKNNLIRGKFFKLASIAAVIAMVTTFTFYEMNDEKPDPVVAQAPEKSLDLEIPKLDLTLTEAQIKESLEQKYQALSESATQKWKTAATNIARATEYIADGTHYISNKLNEHTSGPQSRLAPQQAELNPLRYG